MDHRVLWGNAMNKMIIAALMTGAVISPLLSPVAARAQSDGEAGIRALEASFIAAFNAKDLDGIMKVYAPDVFVFDLVPPRQYVGRDAYRDDFKALLGGFKGPISVSVSDLVAHADGDVGYAHSIQHLTGTNADGSKADLTVRVSDVYRKVGGEWKIVLEHVSVPVDLATGKPDFTSAP
jgi:uncharacterized protein (TIGR02246 family)